MPNRGTPFHIVDVFAGEKFTGNQLAVVLPMKPLPAAAMQRIAAEFNFAETTFVMGEGRSPGEYRVRIFTPRKEVPFAGHPVLGTAHGLRALTSRSRP
jgi:trans-2,3-dihydro-3-hydroxyanthranilate isomerase